MTLRDLLMTDANLDNEINIFFPTPTKESPDNGTIIPLEIEDVDEDTVWVRMALDKTYPNINNI